MTQTTDAGRSDPTTNFMLMSERAFKQRDAALAAVADLVKALERLLACCENHPAFTNPSNQITVGRVEAARAALSASKVQR